MTTPLDGGWTETKRLVADALELPVAARLAFLDAHCSDPDRHADALSWLRACEAVGHDSLLESSAPEVAGPMLAELVEGEAEMRDRLRDALAGQYAIEREIGRGGMATVYLARDERHQRHVAVKLLRPEFFPRTGTAAGPEQFRREIAFAAGLAHPNILPLHDSGEADGLWYYVTPYVDGESLRDRLARLPAPSVDESLRILRDVTRALVHAHRQGLVHRDIKPGNILLTQEGDALLADFGVARAVAVASGPDAEAATGALIGTPTYIAPEQASRSGMLDHRADLYALGVVAYEMLAGAPPFVGRAREALIEAHRTEPPVALASHRPDLPAALLALVGELLAKAPTDRPADAAAVLRRLDDVLGRGPDVGAHARARRWVAAAGLVFILGLALAVLGIRRGGAGRAPGPSIAVLPYTTSSELSDDQVFSEGLTTEILGALARIPTLSVASRQAAAGLQRMGLPLDSIGARLGVATVLEGTFERAGDSMLVTTQLVNAADGQVLWSETRPVALSDPYVAQDQLAEALIQAVAVHLGIERPEGPLVHRGTDNREAYQAYLRGRFLFNTRQRDGLLGALERFEQAVALDPGYAQAYAGMAATDILLAVFGFRPPSEAFPAAKIAAERAIALDSLLAEAHAVLAHMSFVYEWKWTEAEPRFARAIALDPRQPSVRMYYAAFLHTMGRMNEALAQLDTARIIDPLTPTGVLGGRIQVDLGHPDEAIRILREEVALDPRRDLAHELLAHAYLQKGMPGEAVAAMERAAALSGARDSAQLAYILASTGRAAEAQRVLANVLAGPTTRDPLGFHVAMAYAGLGDADRAFAWLEKGYRTHGSFMNILAVSTGFGAIRGDPRFADLLRRMGLTGVVTGQVRP